MLYHQDMGLQNKKYSLQSRCVFTTITLTLKHMTASN